MNNFKIKRNDFKNIYFCSDFHYDHDRDFIWKPRGFNTTQEHNKFIEQEIAKPDEDDLLIFLGDAALNSSYERMYAFMKKIKATKYWIWGNHNSYDFLIYKGMLNKFLQTYGLGDAIDNLGKNLSLYPFSYDFSTGNTALGIRNNSEGHNGITFFGMEAMFEINDTYYFCRHMASLLWDKMKRADHVHLCGHSHGNLKIANLNVFDQGRILDVGIDNAMKHNGGAFFKIEEIDKIMQKKIQKLHDHHGHDES